MKKANYQRNTATYQLSNGTETYPTGYKLVQPLLCQFVFPDGLDIGCAVSERTIVVIAFRPYKKTMPCLHTPARKMHQPHVMTTKYMHSDKACLDPCENNNSEDGPTEDGINGLFILLIIVGTIHH